MKGTVEKTDLPTNQTGLDIRLYTRGARIEYRYLGQEIRSRAKRMGLPVFEVVKKFINENKQLSPEQIFYTVEQSTPHHRMEQVYVFLYRVYDLTPITANGFFQEFLPKAGVRMTDTLNVGEMISAEDLLGLKRGTLWDAE